jgi:hypothetical protein
MNRLKSVYRWDPGFRMTRQGNVGPYSVKAPQGDGIPGWLCLTRDESSKPIAFWIPRKENPVPQPIRLVWDERCFEDTILRVEYTPTHVYLADAWMLNGTPLFTTTTFSKRQELLKSVFSMYTPCPEFETRAVRLRDDIEDIRGYEYYNNSEGEKGIFAECKKVETLKYEIIATDIPDVYKVADVGYLRVQTMALSKKLRTFGRVFTLECVQNEDGTWTPVIDSLPSNTNGS